MYSQFSRSHTSCGDAAPPAAVHASMPALCTGLPFVDLQHRGRAAVASTFSPIASAGGCSGMSSRAAATTAAVPGQWLPENQHPDVAYSVDEVTGIITPLDGAAPKASALNAGMNDIYTHVDEESPTMALIRPIIDDVWNGKATHPHRTAKQVGPNPSCRTGN